ncbi:MAG TPA: LytTR family transcriptional regulator [Lactobacillus sp.]|nr:LytTR family transcriptional regulator [Lactobacillus sp.]
MKIKFESDDRLSPDALEVTVTAATYGQKVHTLMDYLGRFGEQQDSHTVLTANEDDRISVIPEQTVVALEVYGDTLEIVTVEHTYTTHQRLYRVLDQLQNQDFVQISRGVAINLTYLKALESGFSGNMTAIMTTGQKENVSRKYLVDVKHHLGL